jgi:DNA mismatch repair protein MutL
VSVRILEDHVVNRIAAGEVVERPASVVKELVENAIDAGPSDLRVELEAGGKRLVRVTDDGCGMSRQDAMLCIERHATSKIRSDDDLLRVSTMGFRGEALPSIASVSRFQLVTRRREDEEGTRVVIEGGKLIAIEACGCAPGTEVTVRDLFHRVPARRGFMRTTQTEYGHCVEAITRVAMVRPDIDFSLVHNDRETLRAPAGGGLPRRVASLLGPYGEALRSVRFTRGELKVSGLVSPVGVHRQTAASGMYLYVNDRFVRDPVLRKAVLQAYQGLVPAGRYPVVVLRLELPPEQVDMNVHPTKVEVRFRSPRDVGSAVTHGLREGLREHGLYTRETAPKPAAPTPAPPPPRQAPLPMRSELRFPSVRRPEPPPALPAGLDEPPDAPEPESTTPEPPPPRAPSAAPAPRAALLPAPSAAPAPLPSPPLPAPLPPTAQEPALHPLLPVPSFSDLEVIGQLATSYVLCQGAGELVVIDQHAAHERVTLERLQRVHREARPVSQTLLAPVRVSLPPGRAAALEPHLELLRSVGLEVHPEGDEDLSVRAVPPALGNVDVVRLVRDMADDLADEGSGRPLRELVDRVLSSMACHGSVRAHQRLSLYEMRALLKSLDRVDFSVCAHGRPVAIRVGQRELETRFHRS